MIMTLFLGARDQKHETNLRLSFAVSSFINIVPIVDMSTSNRRRVYLALVLNVFGSDSGSRKYLMHDAVGLSYSLPTVDQTIVRVPQDTARLKDYLANALTFPSLLLDLLYGRLPLTCHMPPQNSALALDRVFTPHCQQNMKHF